MCPTNAAGESACLGGRGEIDGSGNVSYCRNGTAGPLCSLCVNVGDYLDEETSTYAALCTRGRTPDQGPSTPRTALPLTHLGLAYDRCLPCGGYDNSFLYAFPLTLLALSPFFVIVIWKARKSRRVRPPPQYT